MNDMIWVKNNERIQDCLQYGCSIFFSVDASLFNLVKELLSIKMLQNQMDVIIWFEYLVELQHIRMSNFPQQVDFIMQPKNAFDVVFEHCFIYCFQCKLSFIAIVGYFINFREVSFSYNVPNVVLTS